MVKNFPEMPNYDEYKFTIWAKVKANGYGYSYGWMLVQDALDCTIGGWNGGDYNIYIYTGHQVQPIRRIIIPGRQILGLDWSLP